MIPESALYRGSVVHKRLRPRRHALRYGVFALLVETSRLASLSDGLRLFSYNKRNLFAIHDVDHGPGDGTPIDAHARRLLSEAGLPAEDLRIFLLTYPRVAGYVFNPLSVYYAYGPQGVLEALIYEVTNTWGERRSYVARALAERNGVYVQQAAKSLFVSPFVSEQGRYGFRIVPPLGELLVGVQVYDRDGPLLKTHFSAAREALNDGALIRAATRYPFITLQVSGAIHYEALKLWLKGVPLARGTSRKGYGVSFVDPGRAGEA